MTIITQNIDDLHERAGSTRVVHLHGEIFKMRSENQPHPNFDITGDILPGDLAPDGGQLRPDIVWFDEEVPMIIEASRITANADIFVVVGTSLVVYPAAGLVDVIPPHSQIYVIDKRIPSIRSMSNLVVIEKPATEGVRELVALLNQD